MQLTGILARSSQPPVTRVSRSSVQRPKHCGGQTCVFNSACQRLKVKTLSNGDMSVHVELVGLALSIMAGNTAWSCCEFVQVRGALRRGSRLPRVMGTLGENLASTAGREGNFGGGGCPGLIPKFEHGGTCILIEHQQRQFMPKPSAWTARRCAVCWRCYSFPRSTLHFQRMRNDHCQAVQVFASKECSATFDSCSLCIIRCLPQMVSFRAFSGSACRMRGLSCLLAPLLITVFSLMQGRTQSEKERQL